MKILFWCMLFLLVVSLFVILLISARTKKAFKYLFFNALIGVSALLILYFTKKYTNIQIYLNEFTFFAAFVFSIPAIIGLLVLNLLF